ncbi:MAG: oligosaccharide flippase family protein [Sphingobium sp.]|uniref:oligosaccharide flippase family protein n=1 Tax=Sphingobium sp. TaxID=1912891 RepID=UPI0029BD25E4|nr:oligosaccharide flippase family protein [Sphingobium sp.]MDX3909850.1 oligosaccharide flippase family protein [Sphingobium sp.]
MRIAALLRGRQDFLRAAFVTLGSRLLDLPSRYGFHLIVAFRLGVLDAGLFYIVFSVLTLAAGAGRLGIDRALTREVARAIAQHAPNSARAIIGNGVRTVFVLCIVATLLMILIADPVARHLIGNPALARPLMIGALSIVPLCLSVVAGGALLGLMRVGYSQMIYSWLWPAIFCICALIVPLTVTSALWLLLASTTINAVIGFVLLGMMLPKKDVGASAGERVPLFGLGWSLFTTEIVQLLLASAPTLTLGIVTSEREVGYFALAWRVALILNLVVSAVAAMVSPRFARAHAQGNREDLIATSAQALAIVFALGALPLIVLVIGARPILELFGAGYGDGAMTLRILLLGQFIAMLSAGAPELLGMAGHGSMLRRINLVAAVCLGISLAVFTPLFGANGAAWATVTTAIAIAVGANLAIRHYLDFVPLAAFRSSLRPRRVH